MNRQQLVSLHAGQFVRTKHFADRFYCITKVYVPAAGGRVLELEGKVWIAPDQVEEILAA